jgi:hypothetical protein
VRIVALSDQHGHLPEIPACDLLIVAGDVCPDVIDGVYAHDEPDRQKAWFETHCRSWLAKAPATRRIVTWGNHDWCGQECSVDPGSPEHGLEILVDAATTVPSVAAGRPISVWASPWTRTFGRWAFMKSPYALAALYATIPEGIDVLVTHQPPFGHGDRVFDASGAAEHVGSEQLLEAIRRIRPGLVVCGHLHEGYGRFDYEGIPIWNVSVVNDDYALVRPPTVIDVEAW